LLERQGWLQRVHGGAAIARPLLPELPFSDRRHIHTREKQRLAQAALTFVHPGETILLDSSTSAYQLAVLLCSRPDLCRDLRVVTNSFAAASVLAPAPGVEVVLLGGVLRPETTSLVGPFVAQMLGQLHGHCAFLSAGGLSVARGLTDADIREVEVKQAMVQAAARVVALIDASKFGRESFLTFAPLAEVDDLITEGPLPADIEAHCHAHSVAITQV
jgi:DeoR family fructose operon transcriptional repressor